MKRKILLIFTAIILIATIPRLYRTFYHRSDAEIIKEIYDKFERRYHADFEYLEKKKDEETGETYYYFQLTIIKSLSFVLMPLLHGFHQYRFYHFPIAGRSMMILLK